MLVSLCDEAWRVVPVVRGKNTVASVGIAGRCLPYTPEWWRTDEAHDVMFLEAG